MRSKSALSCSSNSFSVAMYSWVPESDRGEVPVEAVLEDPGGLLGVAGVAPDELVEGRLGVEHDDVELPGPRPGDLVRLVADPARAEGVGEPPCRVDRHDAGPAPPQRGRDGERRRRRRLADAPRAAADDDRPRVDDVIEDAHGSPSMPARSAATITPSSAGPTSAVNRYGSSIRGEGSRSASWASWARWRFWRPRRKAAARRHRLGRGRRRRRAAGRPRRRRGVRLEVVEHRVAAVDDDRAEGDPDLVLEPVGGLDRFVDRGLLRDGDEEHLAAVRVGEHGDDLVGLGAQRPAAGRVGESARAREEAQGVTGRRGVEDDEVGGAGLLELADPAEDEDLADPRDRRRDDVERAGAHEPAGEPPEAVDGEVLEEGRVRGDDPRPHPAGHPGRSRLAAGGGRPRRRATVTSS